METQAVDWTPALTILAIGLVLGAYFVFRARRAAQSAAALGSPAELERRDLEGQREALVGQLRELEDTSAKLTAEQLQAQRGALELELARVLRALDEPGGASRPPAAATADAAQAVAVPAPARPASTVKGFLWGVGSMAAVAGLFLWVSRTAEVRQDGAPATGQGMGAGSGQQQVPQSGPATDEERQLQARIDQNPEDLEARLQLGEAYLRRGDLMGVWNESKHVFDRRPDDPRAQMLQAIARTAMGQPEMAAELLEKAVAKAPEMEEAHLQLGRAYLLMGREKDAERVFAAARQRFPEDAPEISRIFEELKQQVGSEGATLPQGGENPHAKVGGPGAPATTGMPPAAAAAEPAAPPDPKRRVTGLLEIDPALAGQLPPGAVIYVMARPAGETAGPPIGVVRLPAAGFPLRFELGDGQSMSGAPLPDQLRLDARVDADGDAATKDPGDPRAVLDNVALGRTDVKLVLKR